MRKNAGGISTAGILLSTHSAVQRANSRPPPQLNDDCHCALELRWPRRHDAPHTQHPHLARDVGQVQSRQELGPRPLFYLHGILTDPNLKDAPIDFLDGEKVYVEICLPVVIVAVALRVRWQLRQPPPRIHRPKQPRPPRAARVKAKLEELGASAAWSAETRKSLR